MKSILSASILSANFACLNDEISACENAGVDWIHIDVMDGHFVPNLTMGPFIVEACHKMTSLPLDCHLMVEKPEKLVKAFVKAGAGNITIHPENNPVVIDTLIEIRSSGCRAGIAINPGTPTSILEPILDYADLILVMTVNPGYSGQKFMPETVAKVKEVHSMVKSMKTPPIIEVDGGVNPETIALVRDAGANAYVSASAIFHYPDGIAAGVATLRKLLP